MSGSWDYLVPVLHGSAWEKYANPLTSADPDWPTVGIYCPHDPEPWLLGSFTLSAAVVEDRGERYWAWQRDYVTGDGYLIHLGRQSGAPPHQGIVDDQPFDKKSAGRRAMEAFEQHGIDSPEFQKAADLLARGDEGLRLRIPIQCGVCALERTFRADSVQQVLGVFWTAGIREISLEMFARRVDRRAKG